MKRMGEIVLFISTRLGFRLFVFFFVCVLVLLIIFHLKTFFFKSKVAGFIFFKYLFYAGPLSTDFFSVCFIWETDGRSMF